MKSPVDGGPSKACCGCRARFDRDQGCDSPGPGHRRVGAVCRLGPGPAKHQGFLAGLQRPPAILPIDGLCDVADIVIECAPANWCDRSSRRS